MKNNRNYDYYDLVEFPSHKHLPVPIAINLLRRMGYVFQEAITLINHIPISRRKRDFDFFGCPQCGLKSFFTGICAYCLELEEMDETSPSSDDYYQQKKISNKAKEILFISLVQQQKHLTMLRYIETIPICRKGKDYWFYTFIG